MSNLGVKIIRMLGHEDIIAKVKQIGKRSYRIKDACIIRVQQAQEEDSVNADGQKNVRFELALSPFLTPYMKQDQEVEVEGVLFEPEERVLYRYNAMFSPIIQPTLQVNKQNAGLITNLK
jgi:hypothetical protein